MSNEVDMIIGNSLYQNPIQVNNSSNDDLELKIKELNQRLEEERVKQVQVAKENEALKKRLEDMQKSTKRSPSTNNLYSSTSSLSSHQSKRKSGGSYSGSDTENTFSKDSQDSYHQSTYNNNNNNNNIQIENVHTNQTLKLQVSQNEIEETMSKFEEQVLQLKDVLTKHSSGAANPDHPVASTSDCAATQSSPATIAANSVIDSASLADTQRILQSKVDTFEQKLSTIKNIFLDISALQLNNATQNAANVMHIAVSGGGDDGSKVGEEVDEFSATIIQENKNSKVEVEVGVEVGAEKNENEKSSTCLASDQPPIPTPTSDSNTNSNTENSQRISKEMDFTFIAADPTNEEEFKQLMSGDPNTIITTTTDNILNTTIHSNTDSNTTNTTIITNINIEEKDQQQQQQQQQQVTEIVLEKEVEVEMQIEESLNNNDESLDHQEQIIQVVSEPSKQEVTIVEQQSSSEIITVSLEENVIENNNVNIEQLEKVSQEEKEKECEKENEKEKEKEKFVQKVDLVIKVEHIEQIVVKDSNQEIVEKLLAGDSDANASLNKTSPRLLPIDFIDVSSLPDVPSTIPVFGQLGSNASASSLRGEEPNLSSSAKHSPSPSRHNLSNTVDKNTGSLSSSTVNSNTNGEQITTFSMKVTSLNDNILKEGILKKKGGGEGGRRNWTTRWFRLKADTLSYYKRRKDAKPKGVVKLSQARTETHSGKPFGIVLLSGINEKNMVRDYLLMAESKKEQEEWIEAINQVIAKIPIGATTSTPTLISTTTATSVTSPNLLSTSVSSTPTSTTPGILSTSPSKVK